ncbi:hypothetical protein MNV49_005545 [Pseudohyphozyma bogoriensis]|nr:hypothetical protein MNV49_005545 [Pseudohyphozyma bogoriensis]
MAESSGMLEQIGLANLEMLLVVRAVFAAVLPRHPFCQRAAKLLHRQRRELLRAGSLPRESLEWIRDFIGIAVIGYDASACCRVGSRPFLSEEVLSREYGWTEMTPAETMNRFNVDYELGCAPNSAEVEVWTRDLAIQIYRNALEWGDDISVCGSLDSASGYFNAAWLALDFVESWLVRNHPPDAQGWEPRLLMIVSANETRLLLALQAARDARWARLERVRDDVATSGASTLRKERNEDEVKEEKEELALLDDMVRTARSRMVRSLPWMISAIHARASSFTDEGIHAYCVLFEALEICPTPWPALLVDAAYDSAGAERPVTFEDIERVRYLLEQGTGMFAFMTTTLSTLQRRVEWWEERRIQEDLARIAVEAALGELSLDCGAESLGLSTGAAGNGSSPSPLKRVRDGPVLLHFRLARSSFKTHTMVVLAASVVTKGGKPLLSRQFLGLPRSRLESLLSSFPRLVSPASEHTVLEASGVRFVYTPLEDLYVLLITNTQSNILLDLSTLSLVTRIVTELASGGRGGAVGEPDVLRVSFEILSAWDEVITLGHRENVNLQQVRSILEMESHEEKIQEIIARNKEHEAKEELKRRAKQLEMQRRDMTRRGQDPYARNSSSGFAQNNSYVPSTPSYDTPRIPSYDAPAPSAKPFKTKGMQLGAKGKKDTGLAAALGGLDVGEDELLMASVQQQQIRAEEVATPVTAPPAKDVNPFGAVEEQDVHLVIRETLSLELNRDGGLDSLSLKGDLDLRIQDPAKGAVVITLPPPSTYASNSGGNDLQFKTHPNVDKKAWSDRGEVKLKEGKKGFPIGQGLGVLKWRMTGKDESIVPISINCWPSSDNGVSTVNLEYELEKTHLSLHNVYISVSLPGGAEPTISEAPTVGNFAFNPDVPSLDWTIDEVSEAAGTTTGSLEFEVPGDDVDAFFPVAVNFVSQRTMCGVEVLSITNPAAGGEPVDFSVDTLLSAEDYSVV